MKSLQNKKTTLEAKFTNNEFSMEEISEHSVTLQTYIDDLETAEERWLEVSMLLEE